MCEIEIVTGSVQLLKMSDTEYFSEKYADYVSNSKLGLLDEDEGGSVEKFLTGFKSDYSDSFELGSAVHAMVLQPEFYKISDIRKPTAKLGMFAQEVYSARKEGLKIHEAIEVASRKANYYSGSLTSKKLKTAIKSSLPFYLERYKVEERCDVCPEEIYLSDPMYIKFNSCLTGLLGNRDAMHLLKPTGLLQEPEVYNEYAILCELKITYDDGKVKIVKVKAKLDNFTIDHEENLVTLNDLKTSGKPVAFFMGSRYKEVLDDGEEVLRWQPGSFQKYHYSRQMGMYLWLLQAYILQTYGVVYKYKANMIVAETIPNFRSKVCKVSSKQILDGLNEFKKLMIAYARIDTILQ